MTVYYYSEAAGLLTVATKDIMEKSKEYDSRCSI